MSASSPFSLDRGSSELRDAILEAAARLFAEKGYSAASMREVAEAATCTKPALYYYFESKASLFLEVIRVQTDAISRILEKRFAEPGSVRERLLQAAETYLDHVRENPIALKVLLRAELHLEAGQPTFDWMSTREMYLDRIRRLLHEGVACGEVSASIDLDDILYALVGAIDFRCMLWILQGEPIPRDCAKRALAVLFGGVSP